MSVIRVIYELDVIPGKEQQCQYAWRAIVHAHVKDGALGSVLYRDPEIPNRMVAISRWKSLQHWEGGRDDSSDPEAYALFRGALVEVISRRVLVEIEAQE